MPVVDKLITRIETNKRYVTDIELKALTEIFDVSYEYLIEGKDILERKTKNGSIITTLMKKVKDTYVPKKVKEEHRFGIININYKPDGSRVVQIRVCDKNGRNAKANTGFYKTTLEENIFAKNVHIRSAKSEMKRSKDERGADIGFLLHVFINSEREILYENS